MAGAAREAVHAAGLPAGVVPAAVLGVTSGVLQREGLPVGVVQPTTPAAATSAPDGMNTR